MNEPKTNDDYRPVSILPVLSKVYEKLVLRQMAQYLTDNSVFHPNLSAYRKCHSTTTTLLGIRDDILKAMKRGEVTIAVMADYSKAFDTVVYETVLIIAPARFFQVILNVDSKLFDRTEPLCSNR